MTGVLTVVFELPTSCRQELEDHQRYRAQYGIFAIDDVSVTILSLKRSESVKLKAITQKVLLTKAEELTLNKRAERAVAAALMLVLFVNARNMLG